MNKYLAEGAGTFLLVFLGTLAAVTSRGNVLVTALAFGLTLTALTAVLGSISGAHVNPAVSFGAWLAGSLSTSDIVPYWIAQFFGGALGSLALRLLHGAGQPLGETTFTALTPLSALFLEGALTFVFVFVVFSVRAQRAAPLLIGGALLALHLVAVPLTGAGINPARSIAPVVVSANVLAAQQIWVYVLGPFLGGGLAAVVTRMVGQHPSVSNSRTVPPF